MAAVFVASKLWMTCASTSYAHKLSIKILLAFKFTQIYVSSPRITGPDLRLPLRISIILAKGGKSAMVMKSGERWHCIDPACGCSVLVESNGEIEGQSPRCACGAVMKKNYSSPVFRYLDFLKLPEPAPSRRDTTEEGPMRLRAIQRASGAHASKSLAIRAGLVRTFGSLAGFVVVTFLCWGLYILADAFAHPI